MQEDRPRAYRPQKRRTPGDPPYCGDRVRHCRPVRGLAAGAGTSASRCSKPKPARGGHSNTVMVPTGETETPVDTGFIVYNERNYPNLTALFQHLGVATQRSEMSFARFARRRPARIFERCGLSGLFGQAQQRRQASASG